MSDYQTKQASVQPQGFTVAPQAVHSMLYPFQRDIAVWSTGQGRAALFCECGMGKTLMQLEWGRQVADESRGRVLIVAPLAVAHQTVREAAKLDLDVAYVRSQEEVTRASTPLLITNYDMIKAFDPRAFAGVVLDESSILKAFSGATKKRLIAMFEHTPYRLACTATPSPNDVVELGNHAEFLGVMDSHEMLARWFINDQGKAGHYRLKGHASADYWRWVTSWAVCISKPSDLGPQYDDAGFVLPPLEITSIACRSTTPARRPTAGCSSTIQ
jgi:superfamily II DNA or RNA helicase